jgi:hypothetical protein
MVEFLWRRGLIGKGATDVGQHLGGRQRAHTLASSRNSSSVWR